MVRWLIPLLLLGCDGTPKADCMGYTWQKTDKVALVIAIRHEPDWRNYPDACRDFNIQGCASREGDLVTILVKEPLDSYKGSCNTLTHEIRHALGESHPEAHSYTPRDYTR